LRDLPDHREGRPTARPAPDLDPLLEVADRVVARDGAAVSMDNIAAEAGIAEAMLYRHFGDKAGLYSALAERYIRLSTT